jgi:uncharacterized membrane protein
MSDTIHTPPQPDAAPSPPPPASTDAAPSPPPPAPTEGLDPKVGGLLAYLLFGWVGGLIMYLTQKHREVRFHGAQSVLLSIVLFGFFTVLAIVTSMFTFAFSSFAIWSLLAAIQSLLGLATFALWVFLCIKGYQLEHFKLPVIGDMAEKWAAKDM